MSDIIWMINDKTCTVFIFYQSEKDIFVNINKTVKKNYKLQKTVIINFS